MKSHSSRKFLGASLLLASLIVGSAYFLPHSWASRRPETAVPLEQGTSLASQAPIVAAPADFSAIVGKYGPAVVNISVTGRAPSVDLPEFESDDPLFDFFHRFGPQFPRPPQQGQLVRGLGSGFIVQSDGLILTNAHVVDGAQEVTVKLTDRREYRAKVLGTDRQTDVAVIKINEKNLPTVQLGNPTAVKVGEPVLAIGSPYGFENSATSGIVSAKSRSLANDAYVPFIQTDVAVNPGNSGGPLFNLRGEVIGINSQIYSRTGGFQGLSFAIPIDVAIRTKDQLVRTGKVSRGRLGIGIQDVDQGLAESFGLKRVAGALVSSVERGSPAEMAGLKPGDVIVRMDGHDIERSADLPANVAALVPGTSTKLEIVRDGTSKTVTVKVAELQPQLAEGKSDSGPNEGVIGLAVRPLEREERQSVGVSQGLLVQGVSGNAALAGILPGDVIVAVNGAPVSKVEQLQRMVKNSGRRLALLIQRDEARIYIPVDVG
jgi:serine protease Do